MHIPVFPVANTTVYHQMGLFIDNLLRHRANIKSENLKGHRNEATGSL